MSLNKQLWLIILSIVLFSFSFSFIFTTNISKHYLEQQLQIRNNESSESIAHSIAGLRKDPLTISAILSAQFEKFHFDSITLVDTSGKTLFEKRADSDNPLVPVWFKRLLPLNINPGTFETDDGSKAFGILSVANTKEYAYEELWNDTIHAFLWDLVLAILIMLLANLILRLTLKPLKDMVKVADNIGEKNTTRIAEPRTKEFKSLAQAINRLSRKIDSMFNDQSKLLEELRFEANYDPISGLMNRKYFSSRVASYVSNEESFTSGVLVVSSITNLAQINEKLGKSNTDAIIKRIGGALINLGKENPALLIGRLSGGDFTVFSTEPVDQNSLSLTIKKSLQNATLSLQNDFPNFSLSTISCVVNKSEQLEGLKNLISVIKSKTNPNDIDIMEIIDQDKMIKYEDSDEIEWRKMLNLAILSKSLKLASFPVVRPSGEILHQECPIRLQLIKDGAWHAAADFIPWAIHLNLVSKIDKLAIEFAMDQLSAGKKDIALNVSKGAISNPEYVVYLSSILTKNKELASHLWLEIPENSVFEHLTDFRKFCNLIKPLGCKIGVEHVGAEITRLGELHDLNLDYIKIDVSVIRNIDENPGNQAFLKGICLIAHSINVLAIAEGVQSEKEIQILPELGIDAMTGPGIEASIHA